MKARGRPRSARLGPALVAAHAFVCAQAAAEAAPRAAVVVRRVHEAPDTDELAARITGELAAAGLRVTVHPLDGEQADARALSLRDEVVAAVLLDGSEHGAGARCIVVDRIHGDTALSELSVPSGAQSAHRLALAVADLLREKLRQAALEPQAAPSPAPKPGPPAAPPRPPQRAPEAAPVALLDLGPLVLLRPGNWHTTLLPALALQLRVLGAPAGGVQPVLSARVSVSGYGGDVRRSNADGALSARQGLGVAEAVLGLEGLGRFTPELSVGVGSYGLGVRGVSAERERAHHTVSLLPVGVASLGGALRLGHGLALGARAQLSLSGQKLALRIAHEEVARSGGTMVAVTAFLRVPLR